MGFKISNFKFQINGSFIFIFSLLISYFLLSAYAHAASAYTVKRGDTLHGISKKFDVSESDIKGANRLKNNKLNAGMKLSIPSKKQKPAKKETVSSKNIYHAVKKGDTLKKIAQRYSVSESELKKMNNLKTDKLKTGRQLLVKNAKNTSKEKTHSNADPSEDKTYTVKKGDNIWRISKKFEVSIEELKELNGLKDNSLKVGQTLVIEKGEEAEKETEEADIKAIQAYYDKKTTPVITSAKLETVKQLSTSDNLTEMSIRERLILFAKKMLHLPYKFGGNGSFGLDCSAYVQRVYGLIGIEIPRSARQQFAMGESVDRESLSTGDLVFFRTYASFPSHVGIYLGNNLFIHASSKTKRITIDSLETPYYFKRFIGAKRVLEEEKITAEELLSISAKEN
jgi:cell wall-associated NlpC family hydrolase